MKSKAHVRRIAANLLTEIARPKPPALAVTEDSFTEEIQTLLAEAAIEISNLDGPTNIVVQRLRLMLRRIERGAIEPLQIVIAGAE